MRNTTTRVFWLVVVTLLLGAGSVQADLVAHWKLDEPEGTSGDASILDSGPSEFFHGTPIFVEDSPVLFEQPGATDDTGTSVDFSVAGIDVPYDPALNPESFTFCVWAKARSTAGFQSVVTSRHDALPALAGYIVYNDNDGNWNFWTGRDGGWDGLVGGLVTVDEWTHLAISFDVGTGVKTIYVDGLATSSDTQLYVTNMVQDFHLGAGGDFGTQYFFDGSLDDAALWSVALEEEDILTIMDDGTEAVPGDLVAHWKLDEPDGTRGEGSVVDSEGDYNGNTPGLPFKSGVPGATAITGTAIEFVNASIDVPYDAELNPESFTVTAWAKPQVAGGYQSVVTSRNDIGPAVETQGYIIYNDAGGSWAFWTGHGVAGWPGVPGLPVVLGEWQHVAITYDFDTMTKTLYLDGSEIGIATDQGYVPNIANALHIGGGGDQGNEFRFMGSIDDVGLWDEALSLEDIQDVMENGISDGGNGGGVKFKRGDVNADGTTNIADAISLLAHLFASEPEPLCVDAADSNDDGQLNIADAISTLGHLFGGGGDLPPPFSGCGVDPTDDTLDCLSYPQCE